MSMGKKKVAEMKACSCCAHPDEIAEVRAQAPQLEERLKRHVLRNVRLRDALVMRVELVGDWYMALWLGFPEPHRVVRVHCMEYDGGRFSVLREYKVPLDGRQPRVTVPDFPE